VPELCGNSHESSEIVKRHLSQISWSTLQMADHFALHHEHLLAHLSTFCTIVLQFLHSLHFGHKLQLAGLPIAGHAINHSVGDKNKQ
jgi:hypothetical protein